MSERTDPTLIGVNGAVPRGYEGFGGRVEERSSASRPWYPSPRRATPGSPNVVVILVDDMGFSDLSPFGGEIDTPAVSALAEDGYRLTNFHAAPLCSPSRAALLTGANPHRAGFGMVAHVDPGYPGYRELLPENLPTLAESFRAGGYATFMVGKWHLTHESLMHDGADRSSWPLQRGFDSYFGSMDGMTTLYHPHRLVHDNSPVTEPMADDDYLTDRLTDEALRMIDELRANEGDRPFFLYFAHHAVHGPVQSKAADIAKYADRYRGGWDRLRQERFERQRELGLFSPTAVLPDTAGERDSGAVPEWDSLTDEDRELFARHMAVYAAAVDGIDQSVARVVERLRELGEYENTIIVVTSDNGGTAEGGPRGTRSYFSQFLQVPVPEGWDRDVDRPLDELGGPRVHGHYPTGWARVSNTPFRAYKGSVLEGGVHTPLLLSWPAGLPREHADSGIRRSFAFISDIAPTVLELAGVTRPAERQGWRSVEIDGVSFAEQLRVPDAGTPRTDGQYLACMAERAFYTDRFKAVATSLPPGGSADPAAWQLYDLTADPTETRDISAQHPELVADLAERWREAAWHNTVFPLPDDGSFFAHVPSTTLAYSQPVAIRAGTPTLERWRSQRLTGARSFTAAARFAEAQIGEGVIVSHGDQGGGYLLYAEDGVLHLSYNAYGVMHREQASVDRAERIELSIEPTVELTATVRVSVDGRETLQLAGVPLLVGMAPFTGISVGFDGGGPVDWELHERRGPFAHSGSLRDVTYTPGERAAFDNEIIVAVEDRAARLID